MRIRFAPIFKKYILSALKMTGQAVTCNLKLWFMLQMHFESVALLLLCKLVFIKNIFFKWTDLGVSNYILVLGATVIYLSLFTRGLIFVNNKLLTFTNGQI